MPTMPLTIVPLCPVGCGSLLVRAGATLHAVVIVKATFTLAPDRSAWPIEADPLVLDDVRAGPFVESALLAAGELLPPLPEAGVMISATAHAPGGAPVPQLSVRAAIFQDGVAALNKLLYIAGDRVGSAAPAPFARMPIVYERAFGGPSIATNPVGVGADGGTQPNVLDPRDLERAGGFRPISPRWAPRASALRAFADVGREADVLHLPPGAPLAALHAAPVDQRIQAIRGDEWIVLDGMHPELSRFQTQLPFARARARVQRPGLGALTELGLTGDTLLVDADRLVASVIWRGAIPVDSIEEARSLVVFAGLELPTLPIVWPEARAPLVNPVAPAPAPEPRRSGTSEWPSSLPDTTSEHEVTAIREAIAAVWDQGVDLDQTAEIDRRTFAAADLPFRADATPAIPTSPPRVERPPFQVALASTGTRDVDPNLFRPTLPFDASGDRAANARPPPALLPPAPPPLVAPIPEEPSADARNGTVEIERPWDVPTADLKTRAEAGAKARRSLSYLPLAGADLADVDLTGADLDGLDLVGTRLTGAKLGGARLAGAKLVGTDLTRATLDGARFDGADLSEARLHQARGRGARFVGAIATRATFARGEWEGADFSDAELDVADFTAAAIADALFVGARLRGARLVDARGAGASFEGASAAGLRATGASLPGSNFRLAELASAQLDGADLTRAIFDAANLEKASLFRANAAAARFSGADLRGANLGRAVISKGELGAADLRGADIRHTKLDGARLDEATLKDAQATLVDLSNASLERTDLSGANLREANLTGVDLTSARLDRADLRDARLDK